jgi:hypothetical protein
MLRHPIELLPHAREAVESLAPDVRLLLVTKGDLLDQERKLAQSGLGELFDGVEIVSHKTPETYAAIFARHGDGAERAMMVGNSLRSDVVPAIRAGSWGVFVPTTSRGRWSTTRRRKTTRASAGSRISEPCRRSCSRFFPEVAAGPVGPQDVDLPSGNTRKILAKACFRALRPVLRLPQSQAGPTQRTLARGRQGAEP